MTREETKAILAILKAGYPNFYKDMTKEDATNTINLWTTMFADDPAQVVAEAVKSLMCTLKFPPTIADVKEKIALITQPQQLTEMEAWRTVKSAISYYNATETFLRLPKLLQSIVGSPNTLREWAQMEAETVDSVIQSNFMRSYKVKAAQEKERAMLPESTKQMIQMLGQRLSIEGGKAND
jgi:hypothetical protein